MTSYDDGWLSHNPQPSSAPPQMPHFQTFPPESHLIAMGWLEQLRRSKLSRVWKKVLVSLVKGNEETTLCIQRQVRGTTNHYYLESLHQCSVQSIQHVEVIDDAIAAGENRFVIRFFEPTEDISFRCPPNRDAVRNWVSTLRLVGQLMRQTIRTEPNLPTPAQDIHLISFEDHDAVSNTTVSSGAQKLPQHFFRTHVPSPIHPSAPGPPGPGAWQQPSLSIPRHPMYAPQQQQQQQQRSYSPQPPTWNTPNPMPPQQPSAYSMNRSTPPTHPPPPGTTRIHTAPVSQPVRPNPQPKQPPLHRSSSAPSEMRAPSNKHSVQNRPDQVAANPAQTQAIIKQRVTMEWALRPPAHVCLRDIALLIPSLHRNFALVPQHDYFRKWTGGQGDLDKMIRKVRFFLHPDKLPCDLCPDQAYLLKLLWDVINDAWEEHKNHQKDV